MRDFIPLSFEELSKFKRSTPKNWDEKRVETAGFVPLSIRLKQYEQAGYVARFTESDFDSHDLRLLWDNPELQITGYDDLETIQSKLAARRQLEAGLKEKKLASVSPANSEPVKETTESEEKEAK